MSMVPEYGQLALIISLFVAGLQFIVPAVGLRLKSEWIMAYARPLAIAQATFLIISLIILGYGFVHDDFSISYIANNSNTQLPYFFKISAIWGAHEGSLLLWIAMLGAWGMAVAMFSRSLPLEMIARVLSILGLVSVGFILFIVETSNPFARSLPNIPLEGADLNPLLQDFGLIIHPPMLYMGYVGLSVAFAFAMAALIEGRLDAAWARWTRPWTTAAWVFLTLGIALGSWWAYYELGWGGWWFWDPVENASLMPWLVATALMHSLAVTEKRGLFKSWTVLLAIFAFSLSLLGTFLVRSGVLTSVHAFASDPERGVFILGLLVFWVGGSLLVYAVKAHNVTSFGRYKWLSRETFILFNNLLLVVACLAVLLGTLYPLIIDFAGLGKISVGPSWFNTMFNPVVVLLAIVLPFDAMANWKSDEFARLAKANIIAITIALIIGLSASSMMAGEFNWQVVLGVTVGTWVIAGSLADMWKKSRGQLNRIPKLNRSYQGMILAHIGVGISIVGVVMVSHYSIEKAVRMSAGSEAVLGDYRFELVKFGHIEGPNYISDAAEVDIFKEDKHIKTLVPEKRRYNASGQVMTEAALQVNLWRDLYVSLGDKLPDGSWGVRLQVKPYMRWVWLGAIFMSLGGLLAIMDKRYRRKKAVVKATA